MKSKKLILFTDLHLGLLEKYVVNAYEIYKNILYEIFSYVKNGDWVFLGDIVDNIKKKYSLSQVSVFLNLLKYFNENTMFLLGNHDLMYPSKTFGNSNEKQEPLLSIFPIKLDLQLIYDEIYKILFILIPYILPSHKNDFYEYLKNELKKFKKQGLIVNNIIIFSHLDFIEIIPLQDGFSFDYLCGLINSIIPSKVILFNGHYHEKSKYSNDYGKLINIGSVLSTNLPIPIKEFTENDIPAIVELNITPKSIKYFFKPLESSVVYLKIENEQDIEKFKSLEIKNPIVIQYVSDKIDYKIIDELKSITQIKGITIKKLNGAIQTVVTENETNSVSLTTITQDIEKLIKEKIIETINTNKQLNDKMKSRLLELL